MKGQYFIYEDTYQELKKAEAENELPAAVGGVIHDMLKSFEKAATGAQENLMMALIHYADRPRGDEAALVENYAEQVYAACQLHEDVKKAMRDARDAQWSRARHRAAFYPTQVGIPSWVEAFCEKAMMLPNLVVSLSDVNRW